MRRTMMVGLLLLAGCSGDTTPTPRPRHIAKRGPKAGDKVIVPEGYMSDVWDDAQVRRESVADNQPHDPAYFKSEAYQARHSHRWRGGLLQGGSLVEVLETGDDFAAVEIVRDRFGDPVGHHGYVDPWWK